MKKIFFIMAAVAIMATGIFLTNHSEVISNNGLTVKQFLAERGIVMNSNSPKAERVYPIVLVSDRPLQKKRDQDAIWIADGGKIFFLFTHDDSQIAKK